MDHQRGKLTFSLVLTTMEHKRGAGEGTVGVLFGFNLSRPNNKLTELNSRLIVTQGCLGREQDAAEFHNLVLRMVSRCWE